MAPAYFSACLRRSLVTQAASAASACVGDRLTGAYTCVGDRLTTAYTSILDFWLNAQVIMSATAKLTRSLSLAS